ncbi:MAG: hypothetical protein ACI8T1_004305 [Verrucomicrobiales bacterium]|jgi:hypothetical protein
MKPKKCEDIWWDNADERNEGVITDELVMMSGEFTMRVVTYEDPETGKIWKYITSDLKLPPGVIVHLYRIR